MIVIEKLPRKFNVDSYFSIKEDKVVPITEVDDLLFDLTEELFEDYYSKMEETEKENFFNKILYDYSKASMNKLAKYLLSKPHMKQREALEYLYGIKDPNIEVLMNLVKIFPKDYERVLKGCLNEFKSYDPEITYEKICDRALDLETLDTLTEFLPPAKRYEEEINNYIYCMIKDITTSLIQSEDYRAYSDKEFKDSFSKTKEQLIKKYDSYKKKNYDKFKEKCSSELIPLYDYVIDNNLVGYLDDGRYVVIVDKVEDCGDTIKLYSGSSPVEINKKDIKELKSNGNIVTVYY